MKKCGQVSCEAPAGALARSKPKRAKRILVVDDDADIRRISAEVLSSSGYRVDAVEDGAVAWETLQRHAYDLLVTDNKMPRVTGVELLKKLHALRMALPVIMATGSLPIEEFTRHPWLQPAATLLKPFTGHELLGTVEKVLQEHDTDRGPAEPSRWCLALGAGQTH